MEGPFGCPTRIKPPLINITPLVDVTLLLLIFFMVSATFQKTNVLDIQTPLAESGVEKAAAPVEIAIDVEGRLFYNARHVSRDELRALLHNHAATATTSEISIRADGRVPYEQVASVLDMVRLEGIEEITLPVVSQKQSIYAE